MVFEHYQHLTCSDRDTFIEVYVVTDYMNISNKTGFLALFSRKDKSNCHLYSGLRYICSLLHFYSLLSNYILKIKTKYIIKFLTQYSWVVASHKSILTEHYYILFKSISWFEVCGPKFPALLYDIIIISLETYCLKLKFRI